MQAYTKMYDKIETDWQQDSEPTATRMRICVPVDLHGFQRKFYFIERDRIKAYIEEDVQPQPPSQPPPQTS